eukprot:Unigene221_Nuclearia_a/m.815 Unigene221_Nuclearia_a/g.815  ORF Unigene221_Nuclearia_a/g.815 Unigene221_Nuclearia_a/m.815 type:complete len:121 (+) Unigene221_Nuclearia_a:1265-1627(+)
MSRLSTTFAAGGVNDLTVDRLLMKNLLLSYVTEREPKKTEILRVLVKILGYGEREQEQMVASGRSSGLFGGLFGAATAAADAKGGEQQQSFSELWIQFLLNEARRRDEPEADGAPPQPAL